MNAVAGRSFVADNELVSLFYGSCLFMFSESLVMMFGVLYVLYLFFIAGAINNN